MSYLAKRARAQLECQTIPFVGNMFSVIKTAPVVIELMLLIRQTLVQLKREKKKNAKSPFKSSPSSSEDRHVQCIITNIFPLQMLQFFFLVHELHYATMLYYNITIEIKTVTITGFRVCFFLLSSSAFWFVKLRARCWQTRFPRWTPLIAAFVSALYIPNQRLVCGSRNIAFIYSIAYKCTYI